jgi:putative transposase
MNINGNCYSKDIILQVLCFKLRFSYRDVEEIMKMRRIEVDHFTIQRWVFEFIPFIESKMNHRKEEWE